MTILTIALSFSYQYMVNQPNRYKFLLKVA